MLALRWKSGEKTSAKNLPQVSSQPNRNQDMPLTQSEGYQAHFVENMNPSTVETTPELPDKEPHTSHAMATGNHRASFKMRMMKTAAKHIPQVAPNPDMHEHIPLTQNEAYQAHSVENINQSTTEEVLDGVVYAIPDEVAQNGAILDDNDEAYTIPDEVTHDENVYTIPTTPENNSVYLQILTDNYDYAIPM